MSKTQDKTRKALEIAADSATVVATLADIGATGGVLVGGKLIWDVVTRGTGRRRQRQAQAYIERLAEALGENEAAAVASELDEFGSNNAWETIEEGFRAMMGAIHETAKSCVALLVADYLVNQELPDREFQLIGGLLAAADEAILRGLLAVTTQFVEVNNQADGRAGEYTFVRGTRDNDLYAFWRGNITTNAQDAIDSKGEPCPPTLINVVRSLDRFEFGEAVRPIDADDGRSSRSRSAIGPAALSTSRTGTTFVGPHHQSGGAECFRVASDAERRLLRLHRYLVPVLSPTSTSNFEAVQ